MLLSNADGSVCNLLAIECQWENNKILRRYAKQIFEAPFIFQAPQRHNHWLMIGPAGLNSSLMSHPRTPERQTGASIPSEERLRRATLGEPSLLKGPINLAVRRQP